jgi:hypothetical protein
MYKLLGTISTYNAIAHFHNSQIAIAAAKTFPACCVFTSRSLTKDLTVEILQFHALLYQSHWFRIPVNSNQSQSHVTTDGQRVGLSWCRGPSGAHDQIFIYFCCESYCRVHMGRPL